MVVGAKVCKLTDGFLWFVCGLYVGILTCPLRYAIDAVQIWLCLNVKIILYFKIWYHMDEHVA